MSADVRLCAPDRQVASRHSQRYLQTHVRNIAATAITEQKVDTTEELGQTYFYAGRPNLSASELFFIIFCEQVALQLGVRDFSAIVAILSGRNIIATRRKPGGTITGTSYASKAARRVFGDAKFPWGIKLPSFVGGYPPSTLRIRMVAQIGTWTGRAVPVVGWVILASDVSQIAYHSVVDYNRIARGDDKLW